MEGCQSSLLLAALAAITAAVITDSLSVAVSKLCPVYPFTARCGMLATTVGCSSITSICCGFVVQHDVQQIDCKSKLWNLSFVLHSRRAHLAVVTLRLLRARNVNAALAYTIR